MVEVLVIVVAAVIAILTVAAVATRSGGRSFGSVFSRRSAGEIRATGPEGMVGETAVVTRAVGDIHAGGMIRGRGEDWPAYTEQSMAIEVGAKVLLLAFSRGRFLVAESDPSLTI